MRNTLIIARREIAGYFSSPVAYIVLIAFLLVAGWTFFSGFFIMGRADMRPFFSPSLFSPAALLVIFAPAVTMRLVAEERKSGTMELLTSLPVRDAEVIIGKFLAAVTLFLAGLVATLVYALSVSAIGDLDWGPVIAGYVGMGLFASSLLAVGLLCSTFTQNQIVAFIVGFFVCAALYFVYWLRFLMPGDVAAVVEFVSVSFHLENMARGVIDSRGVIYYLTVTAAALFLAERSLARQHA